MIAVALLAITAGAFGAGWLARGDAEVRRRQRHIGVLDLTGQRARAQRASTIRQRIPTLYVSPARDDFDGEDTH